MRIQDLKIPNGYTKELQSKIKEFSDFGDFRDWGVETTGHRPPYCLPNNDYVYSALFEYLGDVPDTVHFIFINPSSEWFTNRAYETLDKTLPSNISKLVRIVLSNLISVLSDEISEI